jgi:hypothetical protein
MTDPRPTDNLFGTSVSPKNDLTVDGGPVDEDNCIYKSYRKIEIEKVLEVLNDSSSPSNGDKESILRLTDLVAEERKDVLNYLADAHKVSLGLEDRLQRQTESTASATSFGTDRLKAVKALSKERAGDYKKCIDAWKSKYSVLQKRSGADKLIATTKFAAREMVLKDQVNSVTLEHKYCRKESKLLNNQLLKQDKDLAKISDLLVISQWRLSEANLLLTQVIRERESYKKLQKTFESQATILRSKVDGQAEQKRVHSKEMSLLAVQKLQLALETQRKKKEATKEKLQHAHKGKKEFDKICRPNPWRREGKGFGGKGSNS